MVSNGVLAGMTISALVALGLPVFTFLVLRKRLNLRIRNVLVGALMFIVFALVLEGAMHAYILKGNPETSRFFAANNLAFAFYAAFAAALFEETGRFVGLKFLAKRVEGSGTPLAYGIGHGGIEAVLVALSIAANLVLGILLMQGKLDSVHLPDAVVAQLKEGLSSATFQTALIGGLERIPAFIFHIGWSLLVWRTVIGKGIVYYLLAVLAHAAVDFPAALYQRKVLPISIENLELTYAGMAAVVLLLMFVLLRRRAAPEA